MAWNEIVSAVFLYSGCFFALTGSIGIVRMPDFYSRLHPAGKSDSFAQVLVFIGLMFLSTDVLMMGKLALISAVIFITSPTATHAITKAAQLDGLKPYVNNPEDAIPPSLESAREIFATRTRLFGVRNDAKLPVKQATNANTDDESPNDTPTEQPRSTPKETGGQADE